MKLRYVHRYTDRHGKVRVYFKRKGFASVPLPGPIGSKKFMEVYSAAMALEPVVIIKKPPPEPKWPARRSQFCTLYFVGCDDHVKIGVTNGPVEQRMRSLATAQHRELVLLAKIEDAERKLEKELHQRFAAHRARGEWFKITPEIQSFIDGINNP